jgi:hypothetical protein
VAMTEFWILLLRAYFDSLSELFRMKTYIENWVIRI